MKSVTLKLKNGEVNLSLQFQPLTSNWIEVNPLFNKNPQGIIFKNEHPYLQTQYIFNGVESCWIVSFNQEMEIKAVKKHVNYKNAPMSYLIPQSWVLILPSEPKIPFEGVLKLKVEEE